MGDPIKHGGPAFPCARCGVLATHFQGRQWLCPKHYRFGQMRASAKRHNKAVPSPKDLEKMTPSDMSCADCGREMVWLGRDSQTLVATLQHYRDGTMALTCRSCNTRHAFAPGDSFRHTPPDHKYCPQCRRVLPDIQFSADRTRTGPRKLRSWCKSCSHASHTKWRTENRDYYNKSQRDRRAMLEAREK